MTSSRQTGTVSGIPRLRSAQLPSHEQESRTSSLPCRIPCLSRSQNVAKRLNVNEPSVASATRAQPLTGGRFSTNTPRRRTSVARRPSRKHSRLGRVPASSSSPAGKPSSSKSNSGQINRKRSTRRTISPNVPPVRDPAPKTVRGVQRCRTIRIKTSKPKSIRGALAVPPGHKSTGPILFKSTQQGSVSPSGIVGGCGTSVESIPQSPTGQLSPSLHNTSHGNSRLPTKSKRGNQDPTYSRPRQSKTFFPDDYIPALSLYFSSSQSTSGADTPSESESQMGDNAESPDVVDVEHWSWLEEAEYYTETHNHKRAIVPPTKVGRPKPMIPSKPKPLPEVGTDKPPEPVSRSTTTKPPSTLRDEAGVQRARAGMYRSLHDDVSKALNACRMVDRQFLDEYKRNGLTGGWGNEGEPEKNGGVVLSVKGLVQLSCNQ